MESRTTSGWAAGVGIALLRLATAAQVQRSLGAAEKGVRTGGSAGEPLHGLTPSELAALLAGKTECEAARGVAESLGPGVVDGFRSLSEAQKQDVLDFLRSL